VSSADKPMAGSRTSFHVIDDPAELELHSKSIASVLRICFPGKYPDTDLTLEESAGFHELSDTVWVLLWSHKGLSTELIGLVSVVPYHNGLYVFNLCVKPSYRQQGWALQLLERLGDLALEKKTPALLGNVDAHDQGLIQFYSALGAEIVGASGAGSGGAAQSTVRLIAALPTSQNELPAFFHQHAQRRRMRRNQQQWLMIAAGAAAVLIIAVAGMQLVRSSTAAAARR
jgi:ribosomal protein S18 acetylase RimI-like enzyme